MFVSGPKFKAQLTICLTLFAIVFTYLAYGQSSEGTFTDVFLRFQQGVNEFEGELQTAVKTYRNSNGVELDLVAAVHMGEGQYYDTLNEYFAGRDAVLYELVADENVRPDGSGSTGGSGLIGFIQSRLSSALALEFQLDSINYNRANFIHADLEPQELESIMAAKGETFFSSFLNLVLSEIALQEAAIKNGQQVAPAYSTADLLRLWRAPNRQGAFKHLLGQSLASTGGNFYRSGSTLGARITILDDRNDAALAALQNSLQDPELRTLSLFYGAAHMRGLEQGVIDLGFNKISESWLVAWKSP